jgi:transcriptional regulator with XRE-family HTH domain
MKERRRPSPPPAAVSAAGRIAVEAGAAIRDRRINRGLTLRDLGARSGLSAAAIHRLEMGYPGSLVTYAQVAVALGVRPELVLVDPRRSTELRQADPVHAWMGDVEAAHFHPFGFPVAIDEPYQHFQFAGRGDLVAWSLELRALLHIENRTRFPDVQQAAGSYNAKRAYLAGAIAERIGLRGGFTSVTHVMVGLWSNEALHVVRLRTATFRSLCPDNPTAFEGWWAGHPPVRGVSSAMVLFDPMDRPRSRRWVDLDGARRAEPRYLGYADAVRAMTDQGVGRRSESIARPRPELSIAD